MRGRRGLGRRVGRQRVTIDVQQHRDVFVVGRNRRRAQEPPLAEDGERFAVRVVRHAARVQDLVGDAPDHRIFDRHRGEIGRAVLGDRRNHGRLDAFIERVTRVRIPLVARGPGAPGHQRRHLAQAAGEPRRKADRVAELLRQLADLRRAQQRVERAVAGRVGDGACAVDDVIEQRSLLVGHLAVVQAAEAVAA